MWTSPCRRAAGEATHAATSHTRQKEPADAFHVYGNATIHHATDIGQFETLDVSLVWQDGAFYLATPDGGSPAEYTMLDTKVHPVDTAR